MKYVKLLVLVAVTVVFAGATKGSKAIIINQNWSRSDAQKEFYQYEFPQMYNAVVKDIDTLYNHTTGATSDSIYASALKGIRVYADSMATRAVKYTTATGTTCTLDSCRVKRIRIGGSTGTVIDTVRMIDGTGETDTLCIIVGAKIWKFLPVVGQ
jgi:hypothetical protein